MYNSSKKYLLSDRVNFLCHATSNKEDLKFAKLFDMWMQIEKVLPCRHKIMLFIYLLIEYVD